MFELRKPESNEKRKAPNAYYRTKCKTCYEL